MFGKPALILLCLALTALPLKAGDPPRIGFTLEWGFNATVFNANDFNYLDEDGARLVDDSRCFKFYPNGGVLGGVKLNLPERFSLSLHSGFLGVEDNVRVIPALLRVGFAPRGVNSDGFFVYLDGGVGFRDIELSRKLGLASLGGGYRVALSRRYSLDFMFSLRGVLDHPDLPGTNIASNRAIYCSANAGVGINF